MTCVGYGAEASAVDATNEVTLGNSSVTTLRCKTQTITALSDRRDKTAIEPIPLGLDFIRDLKPSRWIWNCRDGSRVGDEDTGFIAQDLDDAQQMHGYEIPGLVFKPNDDRWEASSGKLLTVAIKAIQELAAKVDMLEAQIDA
ncbi:MAG: tail fiber domain-containing protein [Synergistaceae bacterium]